MKWTVLIVGVILAITGVVGCVIFSHPAYFLGSFLLIAFGGWLFSCAMDEHLRGR